MNWLDNSDTWHDNAILLAQEENLELTQEHWQVLECLRDFYKQYNMQPSMRALLNNLKSQYPENGYDSIKLQILFPEFNRQTHKIAGLPGAAWCV